MMAPRTIGVVARDKNLMKFDLRKAMGVVFIVQDCVSSPGNVTRLNYVHAIFFTKNVHHLNIEHVDNRHF